MDDSSLDRETLAQFKSTENLHKFSTLTPNVLLTDGTKYLVENADCHWLMEIIGLFQNINADYNIDIFQLWEVRVREDSTAVVECFDGPRNKIYRQYIDYTEFPLRRLDLYAVHVEHRIIIMLPGEYGS
jgi:hypothetical protein